MSGPQSDPSKRAPTAEVDRLLGRICELEKAGVRRQFLGGLLLSVRSAKFLIWQPSLWPAAILPALINLIIFVAIATGLVLGTSNILQWIWARPELVAWYHLFMIVLWHVLLVVMIIGSLVVAYYAVLLVAGAVASPFHDRLSRKTEEKLTGSVVDVRSDESTLRSTLRSTGASLGRLGAYLGCLAVLLPLHLIPGFGHATFAVLAACVSALFLSVEYSGDTLDRYGFGLRDKLRRIRQRLPLAAGFGAGASLLLFVPVVNILTAPIAVVGGTVLGLAIRRWEQTP